MGRIELTRFLSCIGCEIADEIFIDIAQHIIVLRTVGGYVLDELDEVFQCACLAGRVLSKFTKTSLQGFEDTVIYSLIV